MLPFSSIALGFFAGNVLRNDLYQHGALHGVFSAEDGPGHGNGVQRLHQQLQGVQLLLRVLHQHGPALHEGGLVGGGQLAGDQLRLGANIAKELINGTFPQVDNPAAIPVMLHSAIPQSQ